MTVAGFSASAMSRAASQCVDSFGATGFRQVLVHPVVDDVARDEQAHLGHMQHRRVVGVCVADFDRNKGNPLEFEALLVDDGDVDLPDG